MENPSQSYGASLAIWDHTVLPATRHKWTRPALTPADQAGARFTYGMEGWVDLGSLIAARPEIEPTTAWSQVRRPNRYATRTTAGPLALVKPPAPVLPTLPRGPGKPWWSWLADVSGRITPTSCTGSACNTRHSDRLWQNFFTDRILFLWPTEHWWLKYFNNSIETHPGS